VGADVLPASLEVAARGLSLAELRALANRLKQVPGAKDVDEGNAWLDGAERILGALRWAGLVAFGALAMGTAILVSNTLRLGVFARRDEIEIMKLVGATNAYVRTPFLLEGMLQGLAGAILAVLGLEIVQRVVIPRAAAAFSFAAGAAAPHLLPAHLGILLGAGAVVGLLGSYLAVARFLRA
ncbi:MAG: cell division protein FtsX, partial [Myxococcales bacterium]